MQGVPNTPLEAPKFGASVSFLETFIRLQYQLDRHESVYLRSTWKLIADGRVIFFLAARASPL